MFVLHFFSPFQFSLVVTLAAVGLSAATGQVHRQSYGYSPKPEPKYMPEPAYGHPEPAYGHPQPAYGYQEPRYMPYHEPMMYMRHGAGYHEPMMYHPEPAYGHPEPAYKRPEPAYGHPEPAYKRPAYQHPEPAYAPRQPAYSPYQPAYAPHQPAYMQYGYQPEPYMPYGEPKPEDKAVAPYQPAKPQKHEEPMPPHMKEPEYLGRFKKAKNQVAGDIFKLDDHTLYIQGFSFDGKAPDVHFWSDGTIIPFYTR